MNGKLNQLHTALGLALFVGLHQLSPAGASTTVDPINRYAYGANLGWMDWRGDISHGAIIGEYICSGYLYAANVGWIHLGDGTAANGIQYQNNSATDSGINHDGRGNLRGYAYGANVGWINFESTGAPRVDLTTGRLSGYAYSANCGWISLSNLMAHVQTASIAPGADTDGDGIADAWERTYTNTLAAFTATSDTDGDGLTDWQESVADTNPLDPDDHLRITSYTRTGLYNRLWWNSKPTRFYRLERRAAFHPAWPWEELTTGFESLLGWNSVGFNSSGPQYFYRIRAVKSPITSQALLIREQPASVVVAQGDSALLSVVAVGAGPISYQWRFQGVNLPGANGSTLSLASVQPANVGDYVAVVSDSSGSITSRPAVVVISAPLGHLVWIPSGTFVMGSPDSEVDRDADESPQTTVTLSHGFWMGTYEVTQEEYVDVMGSNPSHFTGGVNLPVEFLGWVDATNYCGMLTLRERSAGRIPANHAYRLPTEAEREYACRAGTTTRFSYGDDPGYSNLTNYAWCVDNSGNMTHPVGQKLANPWGLHDMHGNVWEWCLDWYAPYPGGSVTDPFVGPPTGTLPIVRGGSYYYGGARCRSAERGAMDPPTGMRWDVGLRVVLAPTAP